MYKYKVLEVLLVHSRNIQMLLVLAVNKSYKKVKIKHCPFKYFLKISLSPIISKKMIPKIPKFICYRSFTSGETKLWQSTLP